METSANFKSAGSVDTAVFFNLDPGQKRYIVYDLVIVPFIVNFLLNAGLAWLALGDRSGIAFHGEFGEPSLLGELLAICLLLPFFTGLIVTAIAKRMRREGRLARISVDAFPLRLLSMLPRGVFLRSALVSAGSVILIALPLIAALKALDVQFLMGNSFIAAKGVFAGLLAVMVTPVFGLRVLCEAYPIRSIASSKTTRRTVVFDFDGTFADTFDAVLKIAKEMGREYGYPIPSPEEVRRLRSLPSREVIRQSGVPLPKVPIMLKRLKKRLRQRIEHLHPIDGMLPTIEKMRDRGYRLGIVSTNEQASIEAFLCAHQIDGLIDFVFSGKKLFGKAKLIRQMLRVHGLTTDQVVYIGDETRDIDAAKQVPVKVIAVAWGFNSVDILEKHEPDFLAAKPDQLVESVSMLLPR